MPCPKCQSENTKKVPVLSKEWRVGAEKCQDCGFVGHWSQFIGLAKDYLRALGTVELECSKCGWASWYDPLAPEVLEAAKTGAHVCNRCKGSQDPTEKAT